MIKIAKPLVIGLPVLAILVGLSGYFYSKPGQSTYYIGCDGNRQSVEAYNSRSKTNANAAGPDGVNSGGLCLGTGPFRESVVTRPMIMPAACIAAGIMLADGYILFRPKRKA